MKWSSVSVPSAFPASQRPIYIHPIAEVTRKTKTESWPLISAAVQRVMELHPDDRILVHTVSYDLTRFVRDQTPSPRLVSYSTSGEKQAAIDAYLYAPASVLLAPSLDRGIDLPEDDCRVIIVAKVPFPNLGDKQVSARKYSPGGNLWYNVRTVRSLVQMTGRGMRSEDDSCLTYILDKQFITSIFRRNRHLLPGWWKDALVWDRGEL